MHQALLQTNIQGYPCARGKVRDVYDLGNELVIVTTDRISAFDWVMPQGIPDKGRILTSMTSFWLDWLNVPNHLISTSIADLPLAFQRQRDDLIGRVMLVRKTKVFPVECVVRGYLVGSGWKEYQQSRSVCGISLPAGLKLSSQLGQPIFTPATKAETGHDENIDFAKMQTIVGNTVAETLKSKSIDLYQRAAAYARSKGIIIADTKFEWGQLPGGEIILIDEVLTPDSSRFWPGDQYREGESIPSFDKQYLRDWLETTDWDKNSPPPDLPDSIIQNSRNKYLEALVKLTGKGL